MKFFIFCVLFTTGIAYAQAPLPLATKSPRTCGTVEECILSYFPKQSQIAIAVARAESNMNPQAKGVNIDSVDCGVFQINVKGHECNEGLMNPEINILVASKMYEKRGWQPWVAYNTGRYKNYLE
jgi:hypothetical protein